MTSLFAQGDAEFSSDMLYRYWLTRELGAPQSRYDEATDVWIHPPIRLLVFCMLNPSTADADRDDPTIRRCKGYGLAWGFHRVAIVNVYGYRATKPADLWKAALAGVDIVGPDNDHYITRAVQWSRRATDAGEHGVVPDPLPVPAQVVCAWGAASSLPKALRDRHAQRVLAVRKLVGSMAYALKFNDDGSPVHPLYQPEDIKPLRWEMAA